MMVLGRPIDGAQATSRTQSEWPSNFSSSSKPPDPSVFSRQIWCDKWATSKQLGLNWLCGWNHQWCKLRGWLLLNDWAATWQLQTRFYSMSRQKSETKEHENTINSSLSSLHYIGIQTTIIHSPWPNCRNLPRRIFWVVDWPYDCQVRRWGPPERRRGPKKRRYSRSCER